MLEVGKADTSEEHGASSCVQVPRRRSILRRSLRHRMKGQEVVTISRSDVTAIKVKKQVPKPEGRLYAVSKVRHMTLVL